MDRDKGILSGVRVVEMGQYLAAPSAAKMMAGLGADVIKLEMAPRGDLNRHYTLIKGQSVSHMVQNHGKRSVCIDVKRPEGAAVAADLVGHCDVFVENFSPGVLAKYGLNWEVLRARNPRLIMCSISGFGQDGVNAQKPANDIIALAMAGTLHLIGYPDRPPAIPAVNIGDMTSGAHALAAVCGALFHRERTGLGQYIDISMVECMASWNDGGYLFYQASDGKLNPVRMGSDFPAVAPMGIFKARDGYVAITILYDQWELFARIIGRPELGSDPRYDTLPKRLERRAEVNQTVETWLQSFESRDEPLAILERNHILSAPVFDVPQAMTSSAIKGRGALQDLTYPGVGTVSISRAPLRFSGAKVEIPRPAPALGEHNAEILGGLLGYTEAKIAALAEAGLLVGEPAARNR
ncbi:MAG TPA: CoA transferase [Candidatus Binataceae bacterium]|nr:CoA transferase [Candidatus Binataceae bacterium]